LNWWADSRQPTRAHNQPALAARVYPFGEWFDIRWSENSQKQRSTEAGIARGYLVKWPSALWFHVIWISASNARTPQTTPVMVGRTINASCMKPPTRTCTERHVPCRQLVIQIYQK